MSMTVNEPSVIDGEKFTVRRTIKIAAPLEKVWSAVTEPAHISQWFGKVMFDGSGVGARGTMTVENYGQIPMRIEAVDEPRMIAYRWGNDDAMGAVQTELDPERSTVFTFTLEPIADGTQLTVVETGFEKTSDPQFNLENHGKGWISELDKLVALLEGDS